MASGMILRFLAIGAITSLTGMAASVSTLTLSSNGSTYTICSTGCNATEVAPGDFALGTTLNNFGGANGWKIVNASATAFGLGTQGSAQGPNPSDQITANSIGAGSQTLTVTFTDVGYPIAFTSGVVNDSLNTLSKNKGSVSYAEYYGPAGNPTQFTLSTDTLTATGGFTAAFPSVFSSTTPYTFTLVETITAGGSQELVASQVSLTAITPEPGFYGVLGLGLAGLAFAVRRARRA